MKPFHPLLAITATLASLLISPVHAEVIKIPVGSQQGSLAAADLPPTGMLMQAVSDIYGEPGHKTAPVGQPPIERWDYDGYSVYFEYDHVIHSVLKGPKAAPEETARP